MSTSADWTRRILIGAVVLVAGSQVWLAQQNRTLKQRIVTQQAQAADMKYLRNRSERTLYEASMQGRCQPFFASARAEPAKRYNVALYFSLERDCMSCVTDIVHQWNDVVRAGNNAFDVHGYTRIDGTLKRQLLEKELQPAFPITNVDDLEAKLTSLGVTYSPVVFVSDAATGRILFTHAPLATEKTDRALVEKVLAIAKPCQ